MPEFKDLAGLSEPLKRLVDVIAQGIGGVSRPLLTRLNADAKAYEVRAVAEAIADSQKHLSRVQYDDGAITIDAESTRSLPADFPEVALEERVSSRCTFQEAKRQSNIERVTQLAASDLHDTDQVPEDRPDSDWITRFFRIAEDISTEEMQTLWGKVLAGEIRRPGTFSLRSLDLLKSVSKDEAELFVRVAQIAFISGGTVFVPNPDHGAYLEQQFGLRFVDLLLLREIGLLAPTDLRFMLSESDEAQRTALICGDKCLFIDRPGGTPTQALEAIVFTAIGRQLFALIETHPTGVDYIVNTGRKFLQEAVTVQWAEIVAREADDIRLGPLHRIEEAGTSAESSGSPNK